MFAEEWGPQPDASSGMIRVTGCSIYSNSASHGGGGKGGGLYANYGTTIITTSAFDSNVARLGGNLFLSPSVGAHEGAAEMDYVLPTPPGYWLPFCNIGEEAEVYTVPPDIPIDTVFPNQCAASASGCLGSNETAPCMIHRHA